MRPLRPPDHNGIARVTRRKRRKPIICDAIDWQVETCHNGHIHIRLMKPGEPDFDFILVPEESYDLAEDILHNYDAVNGI